MSAEPKSQKNVGEQERRIYHKGQPITFYMLPQTCAEYIHRMSLPKDIPEQRLKSSPRDKTNDDNEEVQREAFTCSVSECAEAPFQAPTSLA